MSGETEVKSTTATYQSGEEPMVGDVVECVEGWDAPLKWSIPVGSTHIVSESYGNMIRVGSCHVYRANRFRLISRATTTTAVEPVTDVPPELLTSLDDIIRQVERTRDALVRLYEEEKSPFVRTPFHNNASRCRSALAELEAIRGDLRVSKVAGERMEQKESEAESCR